MFLVSQCFLSWSFVAKLCFVTQAGIGLETTDMYWGVKSENKGVMNLIYFSQPFSIDSICLFSVNLHTVPDDFNLVT